MFKRAMIWLTRGTVWGIWFIILLFNVPLLRKIKKKPLVCAGVRVWSGNGSWLLFFPCMVTARAAWDSAGRPGRGKTQSVNVRKGPPLTSKQRSWPADDFNRAIYFRAPSPSLPVPEGHALMLSWDQAKRHARMVPSDCSCGQNGSGQAGDYKTWLCSVILLSTAMGENWVIQRMT